MKKSFVCAIAALAIASAVFAAESFGTKKTDGTAAANSGVTRTSKSFVGKYDESMTPENSVVIFFYNMGNEIMEFKQINPKFDVDEQKYEYYHECTGWVFFKPVKPGTRYMLTKMKGASSGGTIRYVWDMDFKPNQQVLVLDIPTEPGVYCYGQIWGEAVAYCAQKGEVYQLQKIDQWRLRNVWQVKKLYKAGLSQFKKRYTGTPWVDAYIKKMNTVKEDPLEEAAAEAAPTAAN
ncbi:MAG: hypothetical protein IK015_03735 [Treponema sp.]|nr:hypothetical protein [Treponema sp.]